MKYNLLKPLLVLITLIGALLPASANTYDFAVDGLYYMKHGTDAILVAHPDDLYAGDVVVPCTVTHNDTLYTVTAIAPYAFSCCRELTSVTIPSTVTDIACNAFESCTSLESVTLSSAVTAINDNTFSYCHSLSSIEIPNSVTFIGSYAFVECKSLTSIELPSSVTEISDKAFMYCTGLTSVTIGENVKEVGNVAFSECDNIKDVYCLATTVPLMKFSDTFSVYETATLHVPAAALNDYKTTAYWSSFNKIVADEAVEGDLNGDGVLDLNDLTELINIILDGDGTDMTGDINGDGVVDLNDLTELINMMLNE